MNFGLGAIRRMSLGGRIPPPWASKTKSTISYWFLPPSVETTTSISLRLEPWVSWMRSSFSCNRLCVNIMFLVLVYLTSGFWQGAEDSQEKVQRTNRPLKLRERIVSRRSGAWRRAGVGARGRAVGGSWWGRGGGSPELRGKGEEKLTEQRIDRRNA